MRYILIVLMGLFVAGCAPKLGEDIIIKPEGKVYLEQSKTEVAKNLINWVSGSKAKNEILLKSHIKIENKWHSDISLVSLDCDLVEKNRVLVKTKMKKDPSGMATIKSGGSKIIPLFFNVDMNSVNFDHIMALIQKNTFFMQLKGVAVVNLYGIDITKEFTKEVDDLVK